MLEKMLLHRRANRETRWPLFNSLYPPRELFLLISLLALGLGLRMIQLTNPPLDFHPTRQLRAAIIARGMYYQSLPDADPQLRKLAVSIWSTMENYEPPIFERLVALTYRVMGGENLWVARLYSSLFWLAGGMALYALVRRMTSGAAAAFALAFYLFLPWGVVASRSFQPDPFMVMWVLLAAYALYRWTESGARSWKWTLLAGVLSGLAILTKVMALYSVAAMAFFSLIALLWQGGKPLKNLPVLIRRPQVWVYAALTLGIGSVYYLSLGSRSSGFADFWIVSFSGMLLDSKFYIRWLALIRGILDPMALFAALLGVFLLSSRERAVVLGLWVGYILIGLTFPYQIYTHDYYSLLLVPIVAISLAPVVSLMWARVKENHPLWRAAFAVVLVTIMGYYMWVARSQVVVSTDYNEPIAWRKMGEELPRDASIVALTHDYGNRLKYYSWRVVNRLWPSGGDIDLAAAAGTDKLADFDGLFESQTKGMDFFLVTLFGDLEGQPQLKAKLYDHYPVYQQGDGYILFDLRNPK